MTDIYVDTLGRIDFGGGLVRVELSSFVSPESTEANQKAVLERTGRLVMPLNGFLQAFQSMQNLLNQLEAAGVVTRREGGQPSPSEPTKQ